MIGRRAITSRWQALNPRGKRVIKSIASVLGFIAVIDLSYRFAVSREIAFKEEHFRDHRGEAGFNYLDNGSIYLYTLMLVCAIVLAVVLVISIAKTIQLWSDRYKRDPWIITLCLVGLPLAMAVAMLIYIDYLM